MDSPLHAAGTSGRSVSEDLLGADPRLWERARAGEGEARAELAELIAVVARAELRRRGARPAEIPDLVQEAQRTTFAFLARQAEGPKGLRTFLKYRAWGVLSDHRKKMQSSKVDYPGHVDAFEAAAVDPSGGGGGGGGGPRSTVGAEELGRALADCRERLPKELADVLRLRYERELDTEAIQTSLGLHRNTIHVRVFRALERMRRCMTSKGYSTEDLR